MIVPLLGLVGGALLLIGVSVYLGSAKQDALAREAEERAVALAQRSLARAMSNNARDLAYWDDAVRFLALSVDETWADGNVGPYLFEAFGYELSLVVDGSDRVIYGHLDGERDTAGAAAILGTAAPELAAAARVGTGELPEAVAGVVATTDATYLVAGAQIVVQSGSALVQPEGKRAVLVLAKRLDDDYLAGLAGDLGLEDLNLRAAAPPAPLATAALLDVGGRPVQWLGWRPHRPGSRQLVWLVPALFGATAVFCGLAILVLRNIKASTLAIRQSEARFRDIAEAASDWIWETDSGLGLVYLSDQCTQATGLVPSETLGRALHDLWPVAGDADLGRRQHEALAARAPFRDVLCRLRTASDGIRILRPASKPVADSRGGFRGYRGTASDITSETAALEQARYLAEHDMLTGLPNRLLLHERLKDVLARCRRYAGRGAVLCLDLDRFKDVNDTLGHAAGDALLVGGTRRLRECVREADLVARLGGDEFAIVQTEVGQLGDVQQLCEQILRRFAEPFDLDGSEVLVTASIGVALVPTDGEDAA
ncbi:MAG TPA: diguanylate cyclase, partial [Geminicoccaceae bacterium]|nr:diguanylate cyclase [Geminicoccaceae bacterium]